MTAAVIYQINKLNLVKLSYRSSYKCYSFLHGSNSNYDNKTVNLNSQRCNSLTSKKFYSSDVNKTRSLPQLMAFPEIVWPSLLKTMKNWILVNLIIRPYFDKEFTLPGFSFATKHALQIVSSKVSSGDLTSLDGMVSPETIKQLQNSVASMSVAQRSEINVNKDDIYFSFPYQVGIMFDESEEQKVQKRWVEITMVFHVLRGLKELHEREESPPMNLGLLPEYRDKISICNYRFIKEFTQGHESEWIINIVNHFKPGDFINE